VVWYHNIKMVAGHWPFSETEIMCLQCLVTPPICFQVKNEGRKYPFSQAHSWANSKELNWG